MRFEPGNKFGKGWPRGKPKNHTADVKAAQHKLQQLFDLELALPYIETEPEVNAPDAPIRTKAEKMVFEIVRVALSGKVQAIEIVLERWAGKPVMVEVEKAYVEPVNVRVEHFTSRPKSESDVDTISNPFPAKTN